MWTKINNTQLLKQPVQLLQLVSLEIPSQEEKDYESVALHVNQQKLKSWKLVLSLIRESFFLYMEVTLYMALLI